MLLNGYQDYTVVGFFFGYRYGCGGVEMMKGVGA